MLDIDYLYQDNFVHTEYESNDRMVQRAQTYRHRVFYICRKMPLDCLGCGVGGVLTKE
jgi:hypothetical protein